MAPDTAAIEALTALGLTEYEASCFVALTQLSQGTAKEISRVADVPQSRVYDVCDQLYQRGLIDVEESDPKRFIALPVEGAIDRLEDEYSDHLDDASDALQSLDSRQRDEDGAWTIASRDDVTTRVVMHVDDATDEVYLHVAHEELLGPEIIDALGDAADRGVAVHVEVHSEALRSAVGDRLSTVDAVRSDLAFDDLVEDGRAPGRLLMVDRETILLSAQKEGLVPSKLDETGLWASEVGHGLVTWLQPLLTARIEESAGLGAD